MGVGEVELVEEEVEVEMEMVGFLRGFVNNLFLLFFGLLGFCSGLGVVLCCLVRLVFLFFVFRVGCEVEFLYGLGFDDIGGGL